MQSLLNVMHTKQHCMISIFHPGFKTEQRSLARALRRQQVYQDRTTGDVVCYEMWQVRMVHRLLLTSPWTIPHILSGQEPTALCISQGHRSYLILIYIQGSAAQYAAVISGDLCSGNDISLWCVGVGKCLVMSCWCWGIICILSTHTYDILSSAFFLVLAQVADKQSNRRFPIKSLGKSRSAHFLIGNMKNGRNSQASFAKFAKVNAKLVETAGNRFRK